MMPARWTEVRPRTAQELAGTSVLSLPLDEAFAKVRTESPKDDEADYALPVWAGELPLRLTPLAPIPDLQRSSEIEVSAYMQPYRQRQHED